MNAFDKHYRVCYPAQQEVDMDKLYSAAEAGEMSGRGSSAVRKIALRQAQTDQPLGQYVKGAGWVFTEADVERLRAMNPMGGPSRQGWPGRAER